jgi:hypothetical protein
MTAFMVTFVVIVSGAGVGGWFEIHDQFHEISECRLFAAYTMGNQNTPKTRELKRWCQMEANGPNCKVIHYNFGETEIRVGDYKTYGFK